MAGAAAPLPHGLAAGPAMVSPDAASNRHVHAASGGGAHRRFFKVASGLTSVAFALVVVACIASLTDTSRISLDAKQGAERKAPGTLSASFRADADKALHLKESKSKYDAAKDRVQSLHNKLYKLEDQLKGEMSAEAQSRTNLVNQIRGVEGLPALVSAPAPVPIVDSSEVKGASAQAAETGNSEETKVTAVETHPSAAEEATNAAESGEIKLDDPVEKDLKDIVAHHLRSISASVAAAKTTRDAADAAEHALGYTQREAGQVGDLAKQSEKQAKRIVEAAKLTTEARDAMRAALEQSSQIVDYNTHAAQAVAQDAGFVSTAASAVAKFLHGIFRDRKAVHKAAKSAISAMDDDVAASDKLLKNIHHQSSMAKAARKRADQSAQESTQAAQQSVNGEQASVQAGMKAVEYARMGEEEAARMSQEEQRLMMEERQVEQEEEVLREEEFGLPAAPVVPPVVPPVIPPVRQPPYEPYEPYGYGGAAYSNPYGALDDGMESAATGPSWYTGSPLKHAKELVDSVVVLMQHFTHTLENAGTNCAAVRRATAHYEREMGIYHSQGVGLGDALSDEDMGLVEEYANAQVQSIATEFQNTVANAEMMCGMSVMPGPQLGMGPTVAPMPLQAPMVYREPLSEPMIGGYAAPPVAPVPMEPMYGSPYGMYQQQGGQNTQTLSQQPAAGLGSSQQMPSAL